MNGDFGIFAPDPGSFQDMGPEVPEHPEFGNCQEQVGFRGDRKSEILVGLGGGNPLCLQPAQIIHPGGQRGGQLQGRRSPGLVVAGRVNSGTLELPQTCREKDLRLIIET